MWISRHLQKFHPWEFRHHWIYIIYMHSTMAGQIVMSRIEKWHWSGKVYSLAGSFATMHFVAAGCEVCIPSFLVPKHGSVSDLEKVVPHLVAAAVRKARMQKGTRNYSWAKQINDFAEEMNPVLDHHSASESKDSQPGMPLRQFNYESHCTVWTACFSISVRVGFILWKLDPHYMCHHNVLIPGFWGIRYLVPMSFHVDLHTIHV